MSEKPNCECHREPMYWHKSDRYRLGGRWECAVKQRERSLRATRAKAQQNRDRARAWRLAHREEISERKRLYRLLHAEEVREVERRRRAADPEGTAEWRANGKRRYRARKARVLSDGHTRRQVFDRDGGRCQICGVHLELRGWHEDHVIPLSLGGSDTLENVQATCVSCNTSKGARVA